MFLEHFNDHSTSISIFTDGSKTPDDVGFSVVTPDAIINKRLTQYTSIFSAEVLAVINALKYIFNSNSSGKNFTIFTDSLSILSSLKKL